MARQPTFTTDNIVAILKAAPEGGSYDTVLRRAGVSISTSSIMAWIREGTRDLAQGKETGYGLFTERWNAAYPGPPMRHDEVRLQEMNRALAQLGEKAPEEAGASA